MTPYRSGDKTVEINGKNCRLRLSVSALAQIAFLLNAETPKALADRLRRATLADWNAIFRCVAIPPFSAPLSRTEMERALPILSELIAEGLRA